MPSDRPNSPGGPEPALLEDSAEDLYEHAPCGYLSTLPDGTIVKVNETFLSWTGHSRHDVVRRKRFAELLTAGGRIYHETHLAPLLQMQGTVREIALEVVCANGRRLPVLVNAVLKRNADGSPLLIRTTVFDATDRKQYERELLRARNHERAARERTERLQRITAGLAGALTPEQIGAAIVPELVGGTGAARALLAVLDDEDRLQIITRWGGGDETIGDAWETRADLPGSAVTLALRSGEPVFDDSPAHPGDAAALAVLPLVAAGRSLGALSLEFAGTRELADAERAFLVACAGQCAQALERAQLHERTADAARRSAFHAEASRALDEVQGFSERAQRLLDLMVRNLGDLAWIELREDGHRVPVAAAHRDGTARDELLQVARSSQVGAHAAAAIEAAAASGRPQVIAGSPSGGALPAPDGRRTAHSYVALPLRARGSALGMLVLARFEPERRFRASDLPFLAELADRAGLALENARLYEEKRDVAHTLQRSLLAAARPGDPRFEVATHYRPAIETLEVGGDWYDTFATGEDRIGVVVGDVVGRGLVAASAMGQLRSAVRALAGVDIGPAQLIDHLDGFVGEIEAARWATLSLADVDLAAGRARFASAGHPPPLLAVPGEGGRFLWEGRSPPLGVGAPGGRRAEAEVALGPGTRLLLYTDGLVERRGLPLDHGLGRLVAEFDRRRATPLPTLVDEVTDAMLVGEQHRDDVCLLCLQLAAASG